MTYVPTRVVPTQWSYSPHLVKTRRLRSNKKCSSTLCVDMRTWDTDMDFCTDGHVNLKTSIEFCFLLAVFTSVFLHSKVLFNILQMKELEMQFCLERVNDLLWLSSEGEDELSCRLQGNSQWDTGWFSGWCAHSLPTTTQWDKGQVKDSFWCMPCLTSWEIALLISFTFYSGRDCWKVCSLPQLLYATFSITWS